MVVDVARGLKFSAPRFVTHMPRQLASVALHSISPCMLHGHVLNAVLVASPLVFFPRSRLPRVDRVLLQLSISAPLASPLVPPLLVVGGGALLVLGIVLLLFLALRLLCTLSTLL